MLVRLARAPLVALIVLYRALLSGRGPLRRVRCSFHGTESCSAYGLRRAREARGVLRAVGDIRRRLRRCREVAVYRDGRALAWGEALDACPGALDGALRAAGELPASRALVLRTRAVVADYLGDTGAAADCRRRASELAPEPSAIVVRGPRAARKRDRIRNLLAAGTFER